MSYTDIQSCRICKSTNLVSILHLGEQSLTGVFPKEVGHPITAGPVELVKCDEISGGCGLVQLRQSYLLSEMYGDNYGYRSGLNASMRRHLNRRVNTALGICQPGPGDLVIDIGSNDSTLLQAYPDLGAELIGIDPTGCKFSHYYPENISLIPDFFDAALIEDRFPGRKVKLVTSIAMFYDLESPQGFMEQVERILDDDGIWVFEQSYLPAMLENNAYDTICHEHLNYYALRQIKWMTDRAGLKILDVEANDVNGGSFCITVAKTSSPLSANSLVVDHMLENEESLGLASLEPYEQFRERTAENRRQLRQFVSTAVDAGKSVYGYGASTKGNVVLQYCGFTNHDITAIAEINEDKFNAYTPGTEIPIRSEQEVRKLNPDYLLVLPWHFRDGIIQREADYLDAGGSIVFPLPGVEVVSQKQLHHRAA